MLDSSDRCRVVVGACESLGAAQALRYAVAQARERNAILVVVRVVGAQSPGDLSSRSTLTDAAAGEVRAIFTDALGGMPHDLVVQIVAREGTVGAVLVAAADRESDVLVIGGCSARGVTRIWSGTVARHCARRAVCPVVIVPPPAMARAGRARRLGRAAARGAEEYLSAAEHSGTKPLPRT